ncbi:2OG-Fe(II) oxygenase [Kiloniella spongiae]|uniref:2OG-Fe(II) oxygenase n=1 Tax=Kiloniella spongiae TaxID=1489064 RepID=UPI00138E3258|nr:2OG-Fe(II) oxygenase [Kiloniella spongiae]
MADAKLAGGVKSSLRECSYLWLDDTDETSWVFKKLAGLVSRVNQDWFQFDLEDFKEGLQLIRYDAPEDPKAPAGHYGAHMDIGASGSTVSRKLSISIQLSHGASYNGGELSVDNEGKDWVAPKDQGTAVIFSSFLQHQVRPVTKGTRYALVAWVHGPAFK